VDGSMVGAEPVLGFAVVDGNFNGNGRVDEPNDCGWDSDEVCVSSVRCTCKSGREVVRMVSRSARPEKTYPATSVTSPPPTTSTGSWNSVSDGFKGRLLGQSTSTNFAEDPKLIH
jgi:hypothetical protein